MSWGYIRTMYPIAFIDNLEGWINDVCQITYPREWLSIKKQESVAIYRNIYLIPNTGSKSGATMTQNSLIYNGLSPHLGWFGQSYIPNYWRPRYVTGWDKIPADLFEFVAKAAAINVLSVIGDVLYGIGIAAREEKKALKEKEIAESILNKYKVENYEIGYYSQEELKPILTI